MSTRTKVTKFRLSNHKLMVEVGRHQGLGDRSERLCPFCPDRIEDESHFLLFCPAYRYQREIFLDPITKQNHNFGNLSIPEKLEFLMCMMDTNLCTFIANSTDIENI